MTSGIRVVRFARVQTTTRPAMLERVLISRVLLNEEPSAIGEIFRHGQVWDYVLADGRPSGLTSAISRPDLEQQVASFHLVPLPELTVAASDSTLKFAI